MPNVVVIAGSNGAGKSTAAPVVLRGPLETTNFVNADVIARGLSEFQPESAAFEAGRIMLRRLRDLASKREDFAFETTLASRSFAPWIAGLVREGYIFHIVYLWIASPDMCIARVAGRVRSGGHHVPPDVVARRYAGGLRNFFEIYRPLAHFWHVYDNSSFTQARLVAEGQRDHAAVIHDKLTWDAVTRGLQHAD